MVCWSLKKSFYLLSLSNRFHSFFFFHYPRRSTRFVLCFVFLSYETDVLFFLLMEVHVVLHDVQNDSKFKPVFQFSSILISQINNLLLEYTRAVYSAYKCIFPIRCKDMLRFILQSAVKAVNFPFLSSELSRITGLSFKYLGFLL